MPKRLRLKLFADHSQIHVCDPDWRGDLEAAWTARATEDRVAVARDIVAIGTRSVADVAVEIELLARKPADDTRAWDHVTESSIDVRSSKLAVLGCTDGVEDARKLAVTPGTWRIRSSHAGLERARERIRLQLWRAPRGKAKVIKRWKELPPKPLPPLRRPRTAKQAARMARRGEPDLALEVLLPLAGAGDAAAAASAAEILAFRGDWKAVVPLATALIRKPDAVYAGNVFQDMCCLVRRAARELRDPSIVNSVMAKAPKDMKSDARTWMLRDFVRELVEPGRPDRKGFEAQLEKVRRGKAYRGEPKSLAVHLFGLAQVFNLDDEVVARWDPHNDHLAHLEHAIEVARVHVRNDRPKLAWDTIEGCLAVWAPVDHAQVAPVILLVDPWISPLMTRPRCELVLRTPRGYD